MNKPKLAFGLNLAKKSGTSKPAPSRKPMFGDDNDSDNDAPNNSAKLEEIGGDLDDFTSSTSRLDLRKGSKLRKEIPKEPPKLKSKSQTSTMFGDLSTTLTSRKNAEAAAELDASVYEYDAVYESMKPKKNKTKEDEERKPKYMRSLLQAADVRKRDALIAEEKKIAREREAEGEEYAGKEKFVTEAYKKQQEENKRIEEEEKKREEEEAKKNKGGGMTAFYKKLLEKDEQRHAETLKATEEMAKEGPKQAEDGDDENQEKEEARLAKEINEKGVLSQSTRTARGGLNVGAKKKDAAEREASRPAERDRKESNGIRYDKKQAMRERQSRMLEEQLEQSLKRSRTEEEEKKEEVERAAKSRKTEGEISSAKERYLARKKAAEEEKKKAAAGQ
ncbi:hypothetical protein PT974_08325 [Cladobotryum mycophilum]|uniref:Nuclear speckle splicing regulatory protein 1 N-terminal domain-containing protein n=1 Tax=Cladobotryum mycophilum TaxID=491253 RepID=A0ABR0SE08_9HYPO